jgi:hypothetical protein
LKDEAWLKRHQTSSQPFQSSIPPSGPSSKVRTDSRQKSIQAAELCCHSPALPRTTTNAVGGVALTGKTGTECGSSAFGSRVPHLRKPKEKEIVKFSRGSGVVLKLHSLGMSLTRIAIRQDSMI